MRPQQTFALLCSHLMEEHLRRRECDQCSCMQTVLWSLQKAILPMSGVGEDAFLQKTEHGQQRGAVEIASGPRDAVFLPCLQIPSRNLFFKYLDSKSFRDQLHSICPKDRRGKKKQAPTPATGLCLDRRRNWPSLKINFKT